MYKLTALILIVFTISLVAGCKVGQPYQNGQPNPQVEPEKPLETPKPVQAPEYSERDQTIETNVGKQFTIALPANPSTGYNWEIEFDRNILELTGSEFIQGTANPGMVGTGGEQRFYLRAFQTGMTQVTLTYKRPWEQAITLRQTFTINIK